MLTTWKGALLMKKIILFAFIIISSFVSCSISFASEITSSKNKVEISYDLIQNGDQYFNIPTEEGIIEISIEEISDYSTNLLRTIKSGTYLIKYSSPGAWKASFKTKISSGKMTSVFSGNAIPTTGTISQKNLRLINSKESRYSFIWTKGYVNNSDGIKAIISGNSLKVSGF